MFTVCNLIDVLKLDKNIIKIHYVIYKTRDFYLFYASHFKPYVIFVLYAMMKSNNYCSLYNIHSLCVYVTVCMSHVSKCIFKHLSLVYPL